MATQNRFPRWTVAGVAALALATPPSTYAVDWFLKIDGVKGESTAEKHKGEIEISSFSWGVRRTTSQAMNATTKPCMSEIVFTKSTDIATPVLVANALSGQTKSQAILIGMRGGGGPAPVDFLKLELNNVIVSSVSLAGTDEGGHEALTLRFTKGSMVYTPQGEDGKPGTPVATILQGATC